MSTRLLLVRHGATALTSENRFSGDTGVDLSDEGREQVRALAARLSGYPIAAVYCSPLSRTHGDGGHPVGPTRHDGDA